MPRSALKVAVVVVVGGGGGVVVGAGVRVCVWWGACLCAV